MVGSRWKGRLCMCGGTWEISVPSAQFCWEPKTVLKNKAYFKIQGKIKVCWPCFIRLWAQRSQYTHCLNVHTDLQPKPFSVTVKILVESQRPLLIWPNWAGKWENIHINTNDLSNSLPLPAHSLAGRTSLTWLEPLCSQIGLAGLNLAKCRPPLKCRGETGASAIPGTPCVETRTQPSEGPERMLRMVGFPQLFRSQSSGEPSCSPWLLFGQQ